MVLQASRSIESIKRRAKAISRATAVTHTEALNVAAKEAGFDSFRQMQGAKLATTPAGHFCLAITLENVDLPIHRLVAVPKDLTLDQVHHVIQVAMGWVDAHLHEFKVRSLGTFSDAETCSESFRCKDEKTCSLVDIKESGQTTFTYKYDFINRWIHRVGILPCDLKDLGTRQALMLIAEGSCPPEDCGGPIGFNDIVKVYPPSKYYPPYDLQLRDHNLLPRDFEMREDTEDRFGDEYTPRKPANIERLGAMVHTLAAYDYDADRYYGWVKDTRLFALDNPNPHYRL